MEYIGFFVSILALIYLFFKQQSSVTKRDGEPRSEFGEEDDEEDHSLLEFIQESERKSEKKLPIRPPLPPLPPPPQKQVKHIRKREALPLEQYRLESAVEKRQLKSILESRQLQPPVKKGSDGADQTVSKSKHADTISAKPSRAEIALGRLADKKEMIIYQEIIDKPKGLRPFL